MKFLYPLALSLSVFFILSSVHAEEKSLEQAYALGVKSYQEKNFNEASTQFLQVVSKSPLNKDALLNLGLAEFSQENYALAAAAWRRALYFYPHFSDAKKAIQLIESKVGRFNKPSGPLASLKLLILDKASIHQFFGLALILFICGGYLLVIFSAQKRRALTQELPLPKPPVMGLVFATLFLFSFSLAVMKAYDYSLNRATVIVNDSPVKSGPSEDEETIFTLRGATEVLVHQAVDNWMQVTYPGGLSGWVLKSSLFLTSGPLL